MQSKLLCLLFPAEFRPPEVDEPKNAGQHLNNVAQ
jgi:hypothetical protein